MAFHRNSTDEQIKSSFEFVEVSTTMCMELKNLHAGVSNLHTLQTLSSIKAADAINRALAPEREQSPLNVLLQVNTSGEDSKSGLPPLTETPIDEDIDLEDNKFTLLKLAQHVVRSCPRLRLQGLMTIGSLSESLSHDEVNKDFETLKTTRDVLEEYLRTLFASDEVKWGPDNRGHLLLSMGMSSDFEDAIRAGSDIVRVGTSIFGSRPKKNE